MFGSPKKEPENQPSAEPKIAVAVTTIPTDFYAGANPTITFKDVQKVITAKAEGAMTPGDKKALDKATAPGSGVAGHPATLLGNRSKLLAIGGGLFGLFVIGAGVFYWSQSKAPATPVAPPPKPTTIIKPVVVPTTTIIDVATQPAPTTTPVVSLQSTLEFPSTLLSKAPDLDSDGLTDQEEDIFKTDPGIADTDSDSYLDGSEVYHLYNPIEKEPSKLLDSASITNFVNPNFNYQLYYPTGWALGNVNQDYRDMLFSAISGDHVEVRVFDKDLGQTFVDWFSAAAPGQKYSDITSFATRFGDAGVRRNDKLVYYFVSGSRIYAFVYHSNGQTVNYPGIIEMMARSFKANDQLIATDVAQSLSPTEPTPEVNQVASSTTILTTSTTRDQSPGITL